MAKIRRRTYIVGGSYQIKHIVFILAVTLGFTLVSVLITYYAVYNVFIKALEQIYSQPYIQEILHILHINIAVKIALLIPVVIVIGIFLSHRVAGPLYRIGKSLDDMAQGDYSFIVRLRKRDEFKNLAAKLNNVIDSVKYFVGRERLFVKYMESYIKNLKTVVPLTPETIDLLKKMEEMTEQMKSHLNEFKIGDIQNTQKES